MIGKYLSPVLVELEESIITFEAKYSQKPDYSIEGFRAALRIFMSAFLDKVFDLQQKEGITLTDSMAMAEKAGEALKNVIKTYTDIDTKKLYE